MSEPMIPAMIEINGNNYEVFSPTIFRPFRECFQVLYFKRRVRFIIQSMRNSIIFYLRKDNDIVGYIYLERGGGRYTWCNKNDWVISPYVVREDLRGQGIGTEMLKDLKTISKRFLSGRIFAIVRNSNTRSVSVMKKAGFKYITNVKRIDGIFPKYMIEISASENMLFEL